MLAVVAFPEGPDGHEKCGGVLQRDLIAALPDAAVIGGEAVVDAEGPARPVRGARDDEEHASQRAHIQAVAEMGSSHELAGFASNLLKVARTVSPGAFGPSARPVVMSIVAS